jgi:hypothetical protein
VETGSIELLAAPGGENARKNMATALRSNHAESHLACQNIMTKHMQAEYPRLSPVTSNVVSIAMR